MVDVALLQHLRDALGSGVSYEEPPVRLGGGFYTDNYAFRVAGGPVGWDGPLVLRLFPASAPPRLARREAVVQNLAAEHVPAPRVLLHQEGTHLEGREWFIMQRLPGHPVLGGVEVGQILRSVPTLLRRLPQLTATTQLALQRVDATPFVDAVGEDEAGTGRWLDLIGARVEMDAPGMARGLAWLAEQCPRPAGRPVLCHGDLWGGNLLVEGGRVTGVIDWTLATAAEPALEVGFTTMSLLLAPIPVPAPVLAALRAGARSMCRRYLRTYRQGTDADLATISYYEALRCAVELTAVVAYRSADAEGQPGQEKRPTWDWVADDMVAFFYERTGVTLTLPPPVPGRS